MNPNEYFLNRIKKIFKISKWVRADRYIWFSVTGLMEPEKRHLNLVDDMVYEFAERYGLNIEVNDPLFKQLDGATYLRGAYALGNKWNDPDVPFKEVSIAVVATNDEYAATTTVTVNLDFTEKDND